jgi:hypothetical protein
MELAVVEAPVQTEDTCLAVPAEVHSIQLEPGSFKEPPALS